MGEQITQQPLHSICVGGHSILAQVDVARNDPRHRQLVGQLRHSASHLAYLKYLIRSYFNSFSRTIHGHYGHIFCPSPSLSLSLSLSLNLQRSLQCAKLVGGIGDKPTLIFSLRVDESKLAVQ